MGAFIDLTGQRYGRLTVLSRSEVYRRKQIHWNCICDCGTEFLACGMDIRERDTTSCGCYQREVIAKVSTKHGMARKGRQHKGYQAWCSMKARCDPEGQFANRYAERGITICELWQSFESFWEDMGSTFQEGLTLERVNNDRGYSPDNCTWATYLVQGNNKRNNRIIETPLGPMSVSQAARALGIPRPTISDRLRRGITGDALFAR